MKRLERPLRGMLFGWFYYDRNTGQWHRQLGSDQHGPVLDLTAHQELRNKALKARKQRLSLIAVYGAIFGSGLYLYSQFSFTGSSAFGAVFYLFFEALAIGCGFCLLGELGAELVYQAGIQGWEGQRVVQAPPLPPPGPETLEGADTHGSAKPAEAPAIGPILGGKNREPNTSWED